MHSMRAYIVAIAFTVCVPSVRVNAQSSAPVDVSSAAPVDSATWASWRAFLPGAWSCEGAFSSGRALEADMKFASTLDDHWISYSQADRAPGKFKAEAMWGVQSRTKMLVSTMQDNGGGARRFIGSATNAQLIFTAEPTAPPAALQERFRWDREGDKLRMTWEVSRAPGTWIMGDYLLCSRM